MAILAVDEVWLREPRLLSPYHQPVETVKSADKRLSSLIYPGSATDLANGNPVTSTQSVFTNRFGRHWNRSTTQNISVPKPNAFNSASAYTALIFGKTPSNVNTACWFGLGAWSSDYGLMIGYINSSGYVTAYTKNTSNSADAVSSATTAHTNVYRVIATRWSSGNPTEMWICNYPGGNIFYYTSGGTLTGTVKNSGFVWASAAGYNASHSASQELVALWPIALAESEIVAIMRDPYSLMQPA